jgi:hypothetical protein
MYFTRKRNKYQPFHYKSTFAGFITMFWLQEDVQFFSPTGLTLSHFQAQVPIL